MRVCFVSHTARCYGAEIALLELLQGVSALGVECLVLLPRPGPLLAELDRLGIEWRILKYPWWWRSRRRSLAHRFLRTLAGLVAAVRMAILLARWRCDVVYTNTVAVGTGAFAAWLARTPHVWHLHESAFGDATLKFDFGNHLALRLIDGLSVLVIVVSHALRKEYAAYIHPDKLRMVYQSVSLPDEIEEQAGSTVNRKYFSCVLIGSLEPRKGQAEAIEAFSSLASRGLHVHLTLIGGDEKHYREELQKQVVHRALEAHVDFTGYVSDTAKFIRAADAMLVCSKWEAFGRVTVASMLSGKPVIARRGSGATTELIQDGVTGLLYEGGKPGALAEKIRYLYEKPEERARLGTAARVWAEGRFTRNRYAGEIFDLLSRVSRIKNIKIK